MDKTIVIRNSLTMGFDPREIKRGDKKGQIYLSADLTKAVKETSKEEVIAWFGVDYVLDVLQAKINLQAQAAHYDATHRSVAPINGVEQEDEETAFNLDIFIKEMSALSARGESKEDLEERKSALVDDDMPRLTKEIMAASTIEEKNALTMGMMKLLDEIQNLNIAIARKSKPRKPKADAITA